MTRELQSSNIVSNKQSVLERTRPFSLHRVAIRQLVRVSQILIDAKNWNSNIVKYHMVVFENYCTHLLKKTLDLSLNYPWKKNNEPNKSMSRDIQG